MIFISKFFRYFLFLLISLSFNPTPVEAYTVESLWNTVSKYNYIPNTDKNWLYIAQGEIRLYNIHYPLQLALASGGLGYKLKPHLFFWAGYYQSAIQPYHRSFNEYRLWQQLYWNIIKKNDYLIHIRPRFEEYQFSNQSNTFTLFRPLLGLDLKKFQVGNIYPVLFDELFFQLSSQAVSNSFSKQNRGFVGIDILFNEKARLRIGYLNQFVQMPPGQINLVNHALSLHLILGVPGIIMPVPE